MEFVRFSQVSDPTTWDVGPELWCVCFAAEFTLTDTREHIPFRQYRGDPVPQAEAEKRMAWGRETYPWIIYWIDPA